MHLGLPHLLIALNYRLFAFVRFKYQFSISILRTKCSLSIIIFKEYH
jgi:hypothetical protein